MHTGRQELFVRKALFPVILILATLGGAARAAGVDPYERFNRRVFAFNQGLDRKVIGPLSRLTRGLTPGPIGKAVGNALTNLREPVVILNDLLQLRVGRAGKSLTRLVLNSTLGGLGAIDIAGGLGLRHEANGFGDTLGRYRVGAGAYLYVPVLGPSTVRDLVGSAVDLVSNPLFWVRYAYKTEVELTLAWSAAWTPGPSTMTTCAPCWRGRPTPMPRCAPPICRRGRARSTATRPCPPCRIWAIRPRPPQPRSSAARRTLRARAPSRPCQISKAGTPVARSRARRSRERARERSGPRPNRGPTTA